VVLWLVLPFHALVEPFAPARTHGSMGCNSSSAAKANSPGAEPPYDYDQRSGVPPARVLSTDYEIFEQIGK
jgi:hypothetical protein